MAYKQSTLCLCLLLGLGCSGELAGSTPQQPEDDAMVQAPREDARISPTADAAPPTPPPALPPDAGAPASSDATNDRGAAIDTLPDIRPPAMDSVPDSPSATDGSTTTIIQSFNPGHYLKAYSDQNKTQWAWIFNQPQIKGVMWEVNWAEVEVSRGVYDFTIVHDKLEYLAQQGKRSIIEVRDRSFNTTKAEEILPAYLLQDPAFGGGSLITHYSDGSERGVIAKIWLPAVTDRVNALLSALGAELDGHPFLEAVQIGESSAGFGGEIPADYTPEGYVAQLERQTAAGVAAFPHHFFAVGANFVNGGGLSGPLPGLLVDNVRRAAAGVKEPDLHTGSGGRPRTPTQLHVDTNYVGVIPRVAVGSFASRTYNTVEALWQVASDPAFGYTHLCWIKPLYDEGILQRINAQAGTIGQMSCPDVMSCTAHP